MEWVLVVNLYVKWVGPQELEVRTNMHLLYSSTSLFLKKKGKNWGKIRKGESILRNFLMAPIIFVVVRLGFNLNQ